MPSVQYNLKQYTIRILKQIECIHQIQNVIMALEDAKTLQARHVCALSRIHIDI